MKILDNGIAIVEHDSHIGRWVQECGRLDHDLTVEGHILPLLESHFWIADVGADIGSHTIRYAKAVPHGYVLAFEPNFEEYRCLLHNLRGFMNVTCFQFGLSNRAELVSLRTCDNVGAGYLDRSEQGNVNCVSLDSLFLPHLDFLKLDIEGFELYALEGARHTIARFRPTILVEMNAGTLARNGITYSQIFEFLGSMGYEWKPFAQSCDLMNEPQYDLLATPKTKTA